MERAGIGINMSEEEFEDHLYMLKYFWNDKDDLFRYSELYRVMAELQKRRSDVACAIEQYRNAKAILDSIMENL